jgi:hypothetical protein
MGTFAVLGASVLAFHECTGAKRAWWRGFTLFGWGDLVLAMGPWASEAVAPQLPTTAGLASLYTRMHPDSEAQAQRNVANARLRWVFLRSNSAGGATGTAGLPPGFGSSLVVAPSNPPPESFPRVGHCLWAPLAACVGGVVGRASHASVERLIDRPGP